jgi:hypothetical protein
MYEGWVDLGSTVHPGDSREELHQFLGGSLIGSGDVVLDVLAHVSSGLGYQPVHELQNAIFWDLQELNR